jgi:hypothetical protein
MEGSEALVATMGSIIGALAALVGVMWKGRNNKPHDNPGSSAHFATIEALAEQTVKGIDGMRTELAAIQLTLKGMETVVGGCATAQRYRGKSE